MQTPFELSSRLRWVLLRPKVAGWVAAIAFVLGLLDGILMVVELGWYEGMRLWLNDPGKSFFHVALLPAAVGLLVSRYPEDIVRAAFLGGGRSWAQRGMSSADRAKRWTMCVLAGVLVAIVFGMSLWDAWKTLGTEPCPADLPAGRGRYRVMLLEMGVRSEARSATEALQRDPTSLAAWLSQLHAAYRVAVGSMRGGDAGNKLDLWPPWRPIEAIWARTSARGVSAVVLTLVGGFFAGVFFWTILVLVMAARPVPAVCLEAFSLINTLLAVWLLLRTYSLWYSGFGDLDLAAYPPLAVVLAGLAFVSIIVWTTHKQATDQSLQAPARLKVSLATAITGVSAFFGLVAPLKQELLSFLARSYENAGSLGQAGMLAILLSVLVAVGWNLASSSPSPAPNRCLPAQFRQEQPRGRRCPTRPSRLRRRRGCEGTLRRRGSVDGDTGGQQ